VEISLQSPKSATTPRIPTLLSKHLFIDHKQAFVTRKSDKAFLKVKALAYIQRGIHTLLSQRYASEISQGVPFEIFLGYVIPAK
jgi:hypothetical protein